MGQALLGPPGGLERIPGSSRLIRSQGSRHTYSVTLGGVRRAYRGPRQRRTWAVDVGVAKPHEWATLSQMVDGVLPGPLVWYDEFAQVSNILTPELSQCDGPVWVNAERAGAVAVPVGPSQQRALRTMQGPPGQLIRMPADIPVPHATSIVISAYLTGHDNTPAQLIVQELDPENSVVAEHTDATDAGATLQRSIITATTTHRTVALRIQARNGLTVAAPAVTLTERAYPWATGRGCLTAVADITDEDVKLAVESENDWGRYSGYSMTVTEIG